MACLAMAGVALLGATALVSAENRPSRPASCVLDEDFWAAHVAAAARVEVLLAAGNTVPSEAGMRPLYAESAMAMIGCVPPGVRVELFPITDLGVGRGPVFSGVAPKATSNSLLDQKNREEFMNSAQAKIDDVVDAHHLYSGSDPIGTLYAVGDVIHRAQPGGRVLVVVVTNGWQQTKTVNLFRYNDDPSRHVDEVERRLRHDDAFPDLTNADLVFAGVTRGDTHMKTGYREILGLRRFWERLVHKAGGVVIAFDQVLPGFVTPL